MDRWMDRWMDGWMNGWWMVVRWIMDGWMDGWMVGRWMDGCEWQQNMTPQNIMLFAVRIILS